MHADQRTVAAQATQKAGGSSRHNVTRSLRDMEYQGTIATDAASPEPGPALVRPVHDDYAGFLRFREQQLDSEERENAQFDKRLAEEEKWIRQGIKARRTRNEGRVRALKAMREERRQRRDQAVRADFGMETAERSGKRVVELEHVSKRFGDNLVIDDFSTLIKRGDRIGIVGANGAGKTTLIKLLLGELPPDSGTVKPGTQTAWLSTSTTRACLRALLDHRADVKRSFSALGRRPGRTRRSPGPALRTRTARPGATGR